MTAGSVICDCICMSGGGASGGGAMWHGGFDRRALCQMNGAVVLYTFLCSKLQMREIL